MLTLKLITEETDRVIAGLEKKHFQNAKETIAQVLELNNKRRATQNLLDKNLAEVNSLSKSIGMLMKEGKKEEAEATKKHVSEIKETSKTLQAEMDKAAEDMQALLYTIPNIPYEEVPEGATAADNVVEKMGGMETELPKDALPHWELAKKYDLPAARADQLLPRRGTQCRLYGNHAADGGERRFGLWHRPAPRQGRADVSLRSR